MTAYNPVNTDIIKGEDWAGEMGAKWLASLDRFEGMIAPIGAALLTRANYQPGERVLDIGSGGRATTLTDERSRCAFFAAPCSGSGRDDGLQGMAGLGAGLTNCDQPIRAKAAEPAGVLGVAVGDVFDRSTEPSASAVSKPSPRITSILRTHRQIFSSAKS